MEIAERGEGGGGPALCTPGSKRANEYAVERS